MIPLPSLADEVVRLRGWDEADVPAMLEAFGDPVFLRFSDWAPRTVPRRVVRLRARGSPTGAPALKGGRRDTVMFGLSPSELRQANAADVSRPVSGRSPH